MATAVVIASNVGASMAAATGRPNQGHLVWAANMGVWWLTYLTGTQSLSALYSHDFAIWFAPAGSPFALNQAHNSEGRDLCCAYANLASTDILHVQDVEGTSASDHSRFTLGATWSNTNAELQTGNANAAPSANCLVLDSTGTPWLNQAGGGGNSCAIYKGSNADAGSSWTAGFGSQQILFASGPFCSSAAIFSIGSGNVLAITDLCASGTTMTNLKAGPTSGGTLGTVVNVFGVALTAVDTNAWGACARTTSDIHAVALSNNSNTYSHARWNGTSWSAGDAVPNLTYGTNSGIFLATDGTFVWAFVIDSSKNIQYTKWTSGTGWSAWTILSAVLSTTGAYITGVYANNNIALAWTEFTGSNYNIVGTTLNPISIPFSDFYMDIGSGSNIYSGSSNILPVYQSSSGTFDGTSIYTPTDGQTTSSFVSVGAWVSIYPSASTVTPFVAQVTAVGAGVNGTITVSTTVKYGTAPASGASKAVVGGPWLDLSMIAVGGALNSGTIPVNTRINVRAGVYANTTTGRTFALTGTTLLPIWWRGYKTTPGDQDGNNLAVAGTDIPSWTFTTGQLAISATYITFSNININSACTTASGAVFASNGRVMLYDVRITNTAANANSSAFSVSAATFYFLVRCYLKSTSTATNCVGSAANNLYLIGCTITGGISGLSSGTLNGQFLYRTVFDSQATEAIKFSTGTVHAVSCSFYAGGANGNGINMTGAGNLLAVDNYLEGYTAAGKAAINNSSGTNTGQMYLIANSYFNNAANVIGTGDFPLPFDAGTLASSGFVAPGSQNFTPTSVLYNLGFPGLFENVSAYQGYLDAGAVQHQAISGGGLRLAGPGGLVGMA